MTLYPLTGPFTDLAAPGIDHNFLNNVETYLRYAADSNITSDGAGHLTVGGTITIPNNQTFQSKDTGGTARNLIYVDVSNNTVIKAAGSNVLSLCSNDTTERARIVPGGLTLTSGTLSLLIGSIARIAQAGPYSVTTTGTFFNHNLGVIPDFVLPVIDSVIGAAHAAAVDFATMTSTQVKLSSDLAGGLNVRILSFKF